MSTHARSVDCDELAAAEFLRVMYEHKCLQGMHFGLFTLPDQKSHWFTDTREMAKAAIALASKVNVYFRVTPVVEPPRRGRGQADLAAALPALWVDVDIAGPGHKKQNLPPDFEAARSIVEDAPPPSLIVHTGHGLHAHWLLQEPLLIKSAGDRQHAGALVRRLHMLLARRADSLGYTIDSTVDLARVLRVPGTLNHKSAEPKRVRLVEV